MANREMQTMPWLRSLVSTPTSFAAAAQAYPSRPLRMTVHVGPQPVIPTLRAAAKLAASDPKVQSTIGAAGGPVLYLDAPEFARYWQADAAKMAEAVAKIGKVE